MRLLKEGKIDVYQAKAIAEIGQVIVNTAKVENEFVNQNGGRGSGFIPSISELDKPKIERPKGQYSNKGYQSLLDELAPA
jgi:hypothetical protein